MHCGILFRCIKAHSTCIQICTFIFNYMVQAQTQHILVADEDIANILLL
jgi:hypothetical protein